MIDLLGRVRRNVMRARRHIAFALAGVIALLALGAPRAVAGPFGLPGIPGLPSLQDAAQSAAYKAALASFGASLANQVPIASSAKDAYATITALPGKPFAPRLRIQNLAASLRASSDGTVALGAGDYQIAVDVFCMHLAAHSPMGHRYVMAPLRGTMADVIVALNSHATGSGIKHALVQMLSWEIQNGVAYAQMPADLRAVADRLVPNFRARLQGDTLTRVHAQYADAMRAIPNAPSFESALGKLGDAGSAMLALEAAHDRLLALGGDADAAMRSVTTGSPSGAAGGTATPWSSVSSRVFERLITSGNYATPATLQIRVLPAPVSVASMHLRGLGELADAGAPVPVTGGVGDPQDGGVQPLTASPQSPDGGGSSNPPPANGVTPPSPPHSSHTHTVDAQHPVQNCQGAANYINNNPDSVGSAGAGLTPNVGPVHVALGSDGQYHATTTVTWSLDPSATTITMPQFTWPGMTQAGANALSQYYSELLNHEDGHITVAQQYAADQGTHSLDGAGATPAAAQAALASAGAAYKQKVAQGLDNETNAYDDATGHGATQTDGPNLGFPGGPNVVLNCP